MKFDVWWSVGNLQQGLKMSRELDRLIEEIQDETSLSRDYTGLSIITPSVVEALRVTPREQFVSAGYESVAYLNRPLPLGFGQTISQPFIVALMTQLLVAAEPQKVLEIGCGSGYQAAVLARLVRRVVSVEIIPELADGAARRLRRMSIDNVDVHCADGYLGWPAEAPFDAIIVTACAPLVPPAFFEQLRCGGRLVLPVGEPRACQELRVIDKAADGTPTDRFVLPVSFVPLIRSGGGAAG